MSVGAGTGTEIAELALSQPDWHFTAVEPSQAMLDVCIKRLEDLGLSNHCTLFTGYLDELPGAAQFDGATSLFVSHFLTDPKQRTDYFRQIAKRLNSNAPLITADLATHAAGKPDQTLTSLWLELVNYAAGMPNVADEYMKNITGNVAVDPSEEVEALIASAGFDAPTRVFQCAWMHAWLATKQN